MADLITELGVNYKGSSPNQGSHLVGWDSGSVRAEIYEFRTGSWPVTHINWWGPSSSVYQGSNIPVRYTVSTSPTLNTGDTSTGYALVKNGYNDLDVNLSPNTTYYLSFFPGQGRGSGNWGMLYFGYTPQSDNWITIHATEVSHTPCTAPTSLVLNKNIQIPGQNVTLSWNGATAGTNLTISSYEIYRSESVSGTYTLLGTTSNTSYTVTAPTTRGNQYFYKIITKGNISGYDSSMSAASSGLKANSLPGAPTVSVNRSVVPSYGGSVTFTVTTGTDNEGQTLTLAYSTTSGGTKISFTSPLTINSIQAATTFYFYTYDGLEYSSSATSQSISINVKPVISSATYEARGLYNAWGGDGVEGSQLGYANSITPKISTNKTGTITVELQYYSLPDSAPGSTAPWNPDAGSLNFATLQQSSISSTTNVVLNSYNIHQYITLGNSNIHWRLRFKLNDGIEDSDFVFYPSDSSEEYYSIARASSLQGVFNQFADSNISGTITGEIWRNIRLKIYNDTSVPLVSASAVVGESTISTSVATSTNGVYRYIDITLPDGINGGATINITAYMTDSNNFITKSVSSIATETKIPTLGALSHGASSIKPFTQTGSFQISTGWPFGTYTTFEEALSAYNCSTTVSNAIKFVHSSKNSASGANRVIKTLTWEKSGDTITTSMNKQDAYEWNYSLGFSSYSGSRTYYCRIEITNLFGKVISTPWISRKFDFREKVRSPAITSIEWSTDESTWTTLRANDKIQEGIFLRFNCSFGLYTTDEVKVSVLLTNSLGERSVECYEFGSPTKITPITYLSTELSRAYDRNIVTNTKSYVYHITSEIADTTNRQWRLRFENSGGSANSSYSVTGVTRQCAPNLSLTQCTINNNYFEYTYTLTDNGGGTLTNYLYDGTQEVTNALSSASGTAEALVTGWEVKTISVKSVSVVTGLITNTKTYYSNSLIVYQLSPTIAYRKNQLGINTKSPDSDATVDIHQATGKSLVLIQGVDSNTNPTKFEINVSTGEIKYYVNNVLQNTIDLSRGILA